MTPAERALLMRKKVGQRIRHARLRAGMSQQQLGDELGVDRIHVLRWEGGTYRPSHRYRVLIAEKTGYPVEFFRHDGPGGKK